MLKKRSKAPKRIGKVSKVVTESKKVVELKKKKALLKEQVQLKKEIKKYQRLLKEASSDIGDTVYIEVTDNVDGSYNNGDKTHYIGVKKEDSDGAIYYDVSGSKFWANDDEYPLTEISFDDYSELWGVADFSGFVPSENIEGGYGSSYYGEMDVEDVEYGIETEEGVPFTATVWWKLDHINNTIDDVENVLHEIIGENEETASWYDWDINNIKIVDVK